MRIDFKARSLPYTHFKTNPGPAEDEKTLDARMAAFIAAGSATPRPNPPARKGVGKSGLRTSATGRAQPGFTHPHPTRRAIPKRDILTLL